MSNVFENPLPILFVGALIFSVLFAIWTQQKKRRWVLAMAATLLAVIAGVVMERLVVTDAEEVASTIRRIAEDMESNDVSAVVAHISSSSPELRSHAESILKRADVQTVSVKRNLRVAVVNSGARKTAIAKFNAVARLKDKSGTFGNQNVPRFMTLHLVKEGDAWRVTRYESEMPQAGMGQ